MIESIIALLALSVMEIVLGIDNIVFISILTSKLPLAQQASARRLGLLAALVTRLLLLGLIFWMAHLVAPVVVLTDYFPVESMKPLFEEIEEPPTIPHDAQDGSDEHEEAQDLQRRIVEHKWQEFIVVTWRDLILIGGGLFLLFKSVREIHAEVEGQHSATAVRQPSFWGVLVQVALMDIIFSIDSVITAVGLADDLWVMVSAVIIAIGVMIGFANQVGRFVDQHPTIKMLALNFLLLIGVMLVAEGIGTPFSKGYVYFAMAFSLIVELLNMRLRNRHSTPPTAVA